MRPMPTAPIAAGSLIAGYAVAVGTGSRPLGGLVLLIGGVCCISIWMRRHDAHIARLLTAVGFGAFVASHLVGLLIGAWPAVLLAAAVVALAVYSQADRRVPGLSSPKLG